MAKDVFWETKSLLSTKEIKETGIFENFNIFFQNMKNRRKI